MNFDFNTLTESVSSPKYWGPKNEGETLDGTLVKMAMMMNTPVSGPPYPALTAFIKSGDQTYMCNWKPLINALDFISVGRFLRLVYRGKVKGKNGLYNTCEVKTSDSAVNTEWMEKNRDILHTLDCRRNGESSSVAEAFHEDEEATGTGAAESYPRASIVGREAPLNIDEISASFGDTNAHPFPTSNPDRGRVAGAVSPHDPTFFSEPIPQAAPSMTFEQKRARAIDLAIVKLGAKDENEAISRINMRTGLGLVPQFIDQILDNLNRA